jgi:quinol monooxygenase YgiN
MSIMLKIRWEIRKGREKDFRDSQKKLCAVMASDHPGVICYHVDYPAAGISEWVEIYANDEVFKAHLANKNGKEPLSTLVRACEKITCKCWGDPDQGSKELLAGFGATYHETADASFALHPRADRASRV